MSQRCRHTQSASHRSRSLIRLLKSERPQQRMQNCFAGRTRPLIQLRQVIKYCAVHVDADREQLAEAGFVFQPTTSAPDNATCFLCHMNLDGWESDDDPAVEHLKLSPNCGWAINVGIEQNVEAATRNDLSPRSEQMTEARKMTFASAWPHEAKRGWLCKTQKVVWQFVYGGYC